MKKLLKIVPALLICSGVILAACVVGTYLINNIDISNTINTFKKNIEAVQATESNSKSNDNKGGNGSDNTGSSDQNQGFGSSGGYSGGNSSELLSYEVNKEELLKASQEYNKNLETTQGSSIKSEQSFNYAALDLRKYGIPDNIYGYVSAPTIGMQLPIYLGANDWNLAYGAGHLCYTSLPVEGETTNVVLAGHTGYIGRWLFDSIRYLNVGDRVTITTYLGTLNYKVTERVIRVPTDSRDIYLEQGKEKLVLFTCIYASYGNYNRYMVICEREK